MRFELENTRRAGRPADYSGLDRNTVQALEFLGLSAYEIKVYLAILDNPRSRVPEIARLARVPQPKVYATVKRLIERGLLESHLGAVNRYIAMSPSDGFKPLLEAANRREDLARNVIMTLQQNHVAAESKESTQEGRVKLFQSRPAAARSFRERMSRTSRDVIVIVRWPLVLADYSTDVRRIVKDKGKVRMLCEIEGPLFDEHRDFVDAMATAGAELRRIDYIPMRMAVFDQQILVMPMSDPAPHAGDGFMMLEVRNDELSHSFVELFDDFWQRSRPIQLRPEPSP